MYLSAAMKGSGGIGRSGGGKRTDTSLGLLLLERLAKGGEGGGAGPTERGCEPFEKSLDRVAKSVLYLP